MTVDLATSVVQEALAWPEKARVWAINDPASYQVAAAWLLDIKDLLGQIDRAYDPHIKRAWESYKALGADKKSAAAPLVDAEAILKRALAAFDVAQEQRRRVEEERLRALARQDEERRRLDEAAALEREAHATGNAALLAEAEAVLATPVPAPTIIVAPLTPHVAGITHKDNWSARVTSMVELVLHAATHPEHIPLLQPNQPALNQVARALKGALKIPGVEAVNTPIVAAGRR